MEKAYIYKKGRRVIHLYAAVVIMVTILLLRQLLLFYEVGNVSNIFEDTFDRMRIGLFVQSSFTLSPNLEYMCTTQNKTDTEKLNSMMLFTNYFVPLLSYLINNDITPYDYMCEIYPSLEEKQKEENAVEVFDEKFTVEDQAPKVSAATIPYTLEQLSNFNFLLSNVYTIDSNVTADSSLFDVKYYMQKNLAIDMSKEGPKILIYHTHSQESFVDSRPGEKSDTVVGVGDELTKILEEDYGIEVYHLRNEYDLINGVLDRSKAYELIEPDIQKILKENPSIQVCIDLHRDGIPDNLKLVTTIDGKPTAKIMFFNGLSKTLQNGKMVDVASMPNPYLKDNMAFSMQMYLTANELFPGLTRKIYIKAYRYNLHNLPRSLLIECGAQTNTVEEEKNAMIPLAKILNEVIK